MKPSSIGPFGAPEKRNCGHHTTLSKFLRAAVINDYKLNVLKKPDLFSYPSGCHKSETKAAVELLSLRRLLGRMIPCPSCFWCLLASLSLWLHPSSQLPFSGLLFPLCVSPMCVSYKDTCHCFSGLPDSPG